MLLKTFRVMPGNATIYTNMYVVADEGTKEGILIDADLSRKKRKKYVDGLSAVVILQSYLEKRRN